MGPKEWMEFVEMADIETAVLFPTKGLRIGNISHPDWACYVARAYNNWLHDRYLKQSPRLKGMALLPLQDVDEAVVELRRAITELGMVGAMLPSRGLPLDLGHKTYWPVYAEAERLGCALGVHGGAHHGMGLDTFETFVPIHGLGHPLSLIIAFTGMVYHGVFDQFPRLRMGFLEGGAGWVTFWMDRLDRSHSYHVELNLAANTKDRRPINRRAITLRMAKSLSAARAMKKVCRIRSSAPAINTFFSPAIFPTRSVPTRSCTKSRK